MMKQKHLTVYAHNHVQCSPLATKADDISKIYVTHID